MYIYSSYPLHSKFFEEKEGKRTLRSHIFPPSHISNFSSKHSFSGAKTTPYFHVLALRNGDKKFGEEKRIYTFPWEEERPNKIKEKSFSP